MILDFAEMDLLIFNFCTEKDRVQESVLTKNFSF